ncbi:MAG: hypothetical protein N2258_03615 [Brevinematales bacterium]|nr:hypothetical protein [Brevinematales bacterium]
MAYRVTLDGAMKGVKFASKEEAMDAMWEFYKDKMSREEFDKFIQSHLEEA